MFVYISFYKFEIDIFVYIEKIRKEFRKNNEDDLLTSYSIRNERNKLSISYSMMKMEKEKR
jgi:hypothetical protein